MGGSITLISKTLAQSPTDGPVTMRVRFDAIYMRFRVRRLRFKIMLIRHRVTLNFKLYENVLFTSSIDRFALVVRVESDACPAMSVVLIVFDGAESEDMMKAARWLMERDENGPAAGAGLRACLSCFYR